MVIIISQYFRIQTMMKLIYKSYLFKVLLFLLALSIVTTYLKSQHYGVSIQISNSMPKGLYLTTPINTPKKDSTVLFYTSAATEQLMKQRQWITYKTPIMKKVAAVPGDLACIEDHHLLINNQYYSSIATIDSKKRPLPQLAFCRTLKNNEYFLISNYSEKSFDSRYFGPIPREKIIAKATPLWLNNNRGS